MSREPFSRAARDDFVAAPAAQRESRDPWHAACGAATDYVLNERDLAVTRTSAHLRSTYLGNHIQPSHADEQPHNTYSHTYLTAPVVLVRPRRVDAVRPPLVQKDDQQDVVAQRHEAVFERRLGEPRERVVGEGRDDLVHE